MKRQAAFLLLGSPGLQHFSARRSTFNMAAQFLSRVEREIPQAEYSTVGPGTYKLPGSMKNSLPGFAPFSSNTKRMVYAEELDGPAPGAYDIAKELTKKSYGAGTLHSKTQRFNEGPSSLRDGPHPGPGEYALPGSFQLKKVGGGQRPLSLNDALLNSLGGPASGTAAPSIPTKFQSYGYECGADGRLALQDPLYPVYSGKDNDAVGPCEYDPKIDVRYKSAPKANFARGSDRGAYEKITAKMTEAPGPGYYNYRSDFDLPEHGGNSYADTNFLMQLNAARKRQSAVFESRTGRDALMQEIKRKEGDPGPGYYDLATSLKADTRPAKVQNFSSSGERFRDPLPRSMRLTVAPGAYNPVTSDFDQMRLKILKKKKMAVRSGWAQNIAFTSTETRFHMTGQDFDGPPANAYYPKVGIADNLPRPNVRGGAFGAKEQRFKAAKTNFEPIRDPHHLATVALNKELAAFMPPPAEHSRSSGSFSPARSPSLTQQRPKFTSNFAPSMEERQRPAKTPPGPPPGAYDVQPKWNKVGTHVMAPATGTGKRREEKMPGPGQYNLDRKSQQWRNPKNIMLSASAREVWQKPNDVPGPGEYNVVPMEGGLLRPSHNVLLSDNY